MPKRTPANRVAIQELYEKLGNGKEVARQLGLHENTVYTALVQMRGICRCGRPLPLGAKWCEDCKKTFRERMKVKRADRKRRGLCQMCNEPFFPPSTQFCEAHRLSQLELHAAIHARKRGAPNNGVPSKSQRERAVFSRYGQDALDLWRDEEGRCSLCPTTHADKAVHVHHLDENPKNNGRENLALLCFRCHRLVHLLIEHPALRFALQWIERKYPSAFMPMCERSRS